MPLALDEGAQSDAILASALRWPGRAQRDVLAANVRPCPGTDTQEPSWLRPSIGRRFVEGLRIEREGEGEPRTLTLSGREQPRRTAMRVHDGLNNGEAQRLYLRRHETHRHGKALKDGLSQMSSHSRAIIGDGDECSFGLYLAVRRQ